MKRNQNEIGGIVQQIKNNTKVKKIVSQWASSNDVYPCATVENKALPTKSLKEQFLTACLAEKISREQWENLMHQAELERQERGGALFENQAAL